MSIQTVLTCPLGSKCEEIKDNTIHRCAWSTKLAGTNPTTGEELDEVACAIGWLPILLVENARVVRGTSAAVESLRNENVAVGNSLVSAIVTATNINRGITYQENVQ